jgi:hypothetical protein
MLAISCRIVRGRVVLDVEGQPPRIMGRVVRCPCCGYLVFAEA